MVFRVIYFFIEKEIISVYEGMLILLFQILVGLEGFIDDLRSFLAFLKSIVLVTAHEILYLGKS
jgi:hypothetical protein